MLEKYRNEIVVKRPLIHYSTARFGLLCMGLLVALFLTGCANSPIAATANREFPRIVVSFPAEVHPEPVTARVLLLLSRSKGREPRYASSYFDHQPVYAIDVTNLKPGEPLVFSPDRFRSPDALAFPGPINWLEQGTYYAQALIDLDNTRPKFNSGPGNLYSPVVKCKLPRSKAGTIELVADQVIKERKPPEDTERIKLVEIRSNLMSDFHGRDIMLRAGVVLPEDYNEKIEQHFPTIYSVPGFGGDHTAAWRRMRSRRGRNSRQGEPSLQMIRVYLDPKVPLGHSVFADSANNGPCGEALVKELIPEIEKHFHAIPHAYGRFVTGHSSGGWSSLWLQVTYPDFFGGCWSTAPDPIDFRAFQTMNIYEDRNGHWTREGYPRPLARRDNNVASTFTQVNRWEYVVGYGYVLDSFNAVFSPRCPDGKPRPIMDKLTGTIDTEVAEYWKRYDIRLVLEENWPKLGPKLKGKIHVLAGAWDTFYLKMAVEYLNDFLKTTDYGGYVEIHPGDHGSFMTRQMRERIEREMAEHFSRNSRLD
ncbi:MAG: alpha/beta hydrolase-fold protein [Planctomycetota bacterium]